MRRGNTTHNTGTCEFVLSFDVSMGEDGGGVGGDGGGSEGGRGDGGEGEGGGEGGGGEGDSAL